MNSIRTIIFITGTRADYGKLKPLIEESQSFFKTHVYVCGMHLLSKFGDTYKEVLRDKYENIYCPDNLNCTGKMDIDLANTIINLNCYINNIKPDLIVVHGDRIEALAGAISGMLNNILLT